MTEDATSWLFDAPAERVATGELVLRRFEAGDVDELVEAVNDSLEHLRPWMPWAQYPATDQSIGEFLEQSDVAWTEGREFQFAIRGRRGPRSDALIGSCGLHNRLGVGALEIGYWVRVDCTRRGVATMAAGGLTRSAFALGGVRRVEIHCDATNAKSVSIPPKLGFRLDRVVERSPDAPGSSGRAMIWVIDAEVGNTPSGTARA
jgi:RimJ/RimL family protein N-acetyltransferase